MLPTALRVATHREINIGRVNHMIKDRYSNHTKISMAQELPKCEQRAGMKYILTEVRRGDNGVWLTGSVRHAHHTHSVLGV